MPWGTKGLPDSWRDLSQILQMDDVDSASIQHGDFLQWDANLNVFIGTRSVGDLDLSSILALRVVERYALLASSSMQFTLLHTPVGEVAVYFDRMRLHQNLHYTQVDRLITLSSDVTLIDNDLVLFDYFYTLAHDSDAIVEDNSLNFSIEDNSGLWVVV